MPLLIRTENDGDRTAIRRVHEMAFGRPDEADLVDQLRQDGGILLSLVAELEQGVAGHILFSRMWIETTDGQLSAVALAPLAVEPDYQRQGIGGKLITAVKTVAPVRGGNRHGSGRTRLLHPIRILDGKGLPIIEPVSARRLYGPRTSPGRSRWRARPCPVPQRVRNHARLNETFREAELYRRYSESGNRPSEAQRQS